MSDDLRKQLGAIDLTEQFDRDVKYRIPTGIIAIDRIIGGGVPSGKLIEINGFWSAGKSRLLLHILAQALELGGLVMLVDLERALERGLAEISGLDYKHKNFIYANINEIITVEQVFLHLEKFIKIGRESFPNQFLIFAVDSVAAMPTAEAKKKGIGVDVNIGAARRAQLIDDSLKKLMPDIHTSNICFIFINQLRDKLDVMFGDQTDSPGGKAIKFWASLRLKMKLMGKIKDEQTKEQIGGNVHLVCQKSKISRPYGEVFFEMHAFKPISKYAGLFEYMYRHSEIEKVGQRNYIFRGQPLEPNWLKGNFPEEYEKFMEAKKG